MLNSKSFLAVDFGAGTLKVAEFEPNEAGGLRLRQYALKSLGQEGLQEATRETAILKALQEALTEKSFGSKNINVCAPGFHVFSKFVKLPPVDTAKVTQIIQFEAQQNVPFPLEEVVWDYQILGTSPTGELEVLLVAIKSEVVEGLFRAAETAGLRLQLVDVSPAALCNAFRYNYGDLEGCTMLLDVGAKTSNLLFFEKGKVYSRSINIGANAITQEFANEAKLAFPDAEQIKITEGFVGLGGAYEEPENPHQAAISKIARQVMTRLHIQVNQTIQFYRGQQGGSAPQQLFLSGGGSVMSYAAQFFAEKLNVPVEYFNPLRNIQLDPALDLEELAKVAHSLGEVVGLGLRNLAHCPVELNLMPKSSLKRQEFGQKKPYFIATIMSLVLVVFAYGWFYERLVAVKDDELTEVKKEVTPLVSYQQQLDREQNQLKRLKSEVDQMAAWTHDRFYWGDLLVEIRRVLLAAEGKAKQKLTNNNVTVTIDAGIWIEAMVPLLPGDAGVSARLGRYAPELTPAAAPTTPWEAGGARNEIHIVTLVCRAVNLDSVAPGAKDVIAYALLNELQSSPLVVSNATQFSSQIVEDGAQPALTFSFGVAMQLKRPLKL